MIIINPKPSLPHEYDEILRAISILMEILISVKFKCFIDQEEAPIGHAYNQEHNRIQ